MNTYLLESLDQLTISDRELVVSQLREIDANGNLATVQVEDIDWGEEGTETRLYDVCEMSEDEFLDYQKSGGVWTYQRPSYWL